MYVLASTKHGARIMPEPEAQHRGLQPLGLGGYDHRFPTLGTAANFYELYSSYKTLEAAYQKEYPKALLWDTAQEELNTLRRQNKQLQKDLAELSETRAAKSRLLSRQYDEVL
jgi:hypothetical protein